MTGPASRSQASKEAASAISSVQGNGETSGGHEDVLGWFWQVGQEASVQPMQHTFESEYRIIFPDPSELAYIGDALVAAEVSAPTAGVKEPLPLIPVVLVPARPHLIRYQIQGRP